MSSTNSNNNMRFDLQVIASWIEPSAKVFDLGCGEGDLLLHLKRHKNVSGSGIELAEAKVASCIGKGLSVLQGDINREILDYQDNAFDYVILSQTLQQVYKPAELIQSMLRVGKKAIVSFPNFGQWSIRLQLLFKGYAPVTKELPYEWHNTPNIRVISINDFRKFAKDMDFNIYKEVAINTFHHDKKGHITRLMPNLRGTYGIFLIGRGE